MITINNSIVYLIGFPGTGKYTIAKALAELARFRLVDNHLINNPIFSVIQADGKTKLPEMVWEKTLAVRNVVLDTIATLSPADFSFIFTNALFDHDPMDHDLFKQIEALAEARGSVFLPVRLICEEQELCRRVVSADRRARLKTINLEDAKNIVKNHKVLQPVNPRCMTLDVTQLTAVKAAEKILQQLTTLS